MVQSTVKYTKNNHGEKIISTTKCKNETNLIPAEAIKK